MHAYHIAVSFTVALRGAYHLTCHSFAVVSIDAVARVFPSGEKATSYTPSVCPVTVLSGLGAVPLTVYSFAVLSATEQTLSRCLAAH